MDYANPSLHGLSPSAVIQDVGNANTIILEVDVAPGSLFCGELHLHATAHSPIFTPSGRRGRCRWDGDIDDWETAPLISDPETFAAEPWRR